jgi:hypothetical protein
MLRWRHGSQNLADAGCAAADDWEPGTPQPIRKTFKLMVCCFALSHVLVLALLQVRGEALSHVVLSHVLVYRYLTP